MEQDIKKTAQKREVKHDVWQSEKKIIKKYLPDILILIGIWVFFYVSYFPVAGGSVHSTIPSIKIPSIDTRYDYSNIFKFIGIILITIGIDIAIRKYLFFKNERKN